ncbi:hypothetical protein HWV62_151 [Athelia sp. TMB]|nr:hypothetical protein HWV62_151 [Athelia sp. TMB]
MEQVLRTVNALNEAGFTDITMYETLIRPHEVNQIPALQSIKEIGENLKQAEQKREEKRLRQIALSRSNGIAKRKRSESNDGDVPDSSPENAHKRVKGDDEDETMEPNVERLSSAGAVDAASSTEDDARDNTPKSINVSTVLPEVRGHTSYLTFACLVPRQSTDVVTEQEV